MVIAASDRLSILSKHFDFWHILVKTYRVEKVATNIYTFTKFQQKGDLFKI